MKICLLGDAMSIHLQRLAVGLAGRGSIVHVVTHKPTEIPGVSVERFRVPAAGLTNPRRWRGRWSRYLRDILRRFDVVNVHFLADWGLTPEIVREGVVVATAWGSDVIPPPGEDRPRAQLSEARRSLLRCADAVTACGPTFARQVAEYASLDTDRVDVVPFGVDLDLFHPGAVEPAPGHTGALIGFYKGFREVYGASYLVRAIPKVLARCPTVRFELIGDGPERLSCQFLAEVLGVSPWITWVPRQCHSSLPGFLRRWRVSVIPSVCEAFGVAALESQAMKVPVVASDVGGLVDTIRHGETGLRVPPGSPEALAEAMVELIEDESRRRRMGEAGRRFVVAGFDQHKVIDQWTALYRRVMDRACVMV